MHQNEAGMTLYDLVYVVIPHLKVAEQLVNNTLDDLIETTEHPLDILKRREQKDAFGLETYRIHLALEGLLERYHADVSKLVHTDGHFKGPQVEPTAGEADAIRVAIDIYQHVRAFQRGERRHPAPDIR